MNLVIKVSEFVPYQITVVNTTRSNDAQSSFVHCNTVFIVVTDSDRHADPTRRRAATPARTFLQAPVHFID